MATGWPMKTTYANGDVYSASDVNDITGTINELGSSVAYAAGKNKIINGNFNIWQRGTSFTTSSAFTADRWQMTIGVSGSVTVSQQTFTAGAAPVAGYESQYFLRYASTNAVDARILQAIEDVRTFANQTVTVSFWAKSGASDALANVNFRQSFGSGGSANVDTTSSSFTLTSSWARYSATLSIPSVSGKTIGANSYLRLTFDLKDSATYDFDLWGVQVEAGSTATAFQTATGTIQGELAACQRYYFRNTQPLNTSFMASFGSPLTGTILDLPIVPPVVMRTKATSIDSSGFGYYIMATGGTGSGGTITLNGPTSEYLMLVRYTHGSSVFTAGQVVFPYSSSTNAYLGFSAEL